MKHLPVLAALLLGAVCLPAHADSIAVTYNLTGVATVQSSTPTTLTLLAQAAGSFRSGNSGLNAAWNPVTYSDQSVLDLTTALLNGTFQFSLADGDTLFGNVFENDSAILASPTQTGPFSQTLTFLGGTGQFAGASGSVSGQGFLGTTNFTVSGNGIVNAPAIPEPASLTLILGGLSLLAGQIWQTRSKIVIGSLR